uniref:Putative secreted protein n=1 Tax=Ixodes ricinus TaxID=34613 RepID=A0A6B0U605_IXORI
MLAMAAAAGALLELLCAPPGNRWFLRSYVMVLSVDQCRSSAICLSVRAANCAYAYGLGICCCCKLFLRVLPWSVFVTSVTL